MCTTVATQQTKKPTVIILLEKYERFIGDIVCNRILPGLVSIPNEEELLNQLVHKWKLYRHFCKCMEKCFSYAVCL